MNLKEILDKYTKESILQNLFDLYPDERKNSYGYNYIIDKLITLDIEETPIVLHMDMTIEEGKESYDVYGIDDQNEYVNLSTLPWPVWISMKINEEVIEYLDDKDILCNALIKIGKSTEPKTGSDIQNAFLEFCEMLEDVFDVNVSCVKLTKEEYEEMNKEIIKSFYEEFNTKELGNFSLTSNELAITDAIDTSNKITLSDLRQGIWTAIAIDQKDEKGNDINPPDYVEFVLKHETVKEDLFELLMNAPFEENIKELDVPNKKVLIIDNSKFNELEVINHEEPTLLDFGAFTPCGIDNSPFKIFYYKDEEEKIIGVRITLVSDPEIL